jgi:hypothetical protein
MALYNLRLSEHGLVAFVVAVFAVAKQVDEHVSVPALAVFQSNAHDLHHRLCLVGVDVEDQRLA